jgi:hypothetical protein
MQSWPPSPEPLLELVIEHNDDSMLHEIAAADYGIYCDEHYAAILKLIQQRNFADLMEWEPGEVLDLIRWSEPEDSTWKPGSTGTRGHWMRLFACAMLLRAGAEPKNRDRFSGEESTVIQLIASSIALGAETTGAALGFLHWRLQEEQGGWMTPYIVLGLLLLAVSSADYDQTLLSDLLPKLDSEFCSSEDLLRFCTKQDAWRSMLRSVVLENPNTELGFVKERVAPILDASDG